MNDKTPRRSGRPQGVAAVKTVFGMDEMLFLIFKHVDIVTEATVLPFVSKQWNRVAATFARPVKLSFTLSSDASAPSTFEWNQYSDTYPHFYYESSSLDITSPVKQVKIITILQPSVHHEPAREH